MISRESSFLFNNLILLASCFAVLWGTLFLVTSPKPSPASKFRSTPIGTTASWCRSDCSWLFLTGVGPLFAWRAARPSEEPAPCNFQWPGIASLVLVIALIAAGMRQFYALISFGFCLFVALTIIIEFYKGSSAIGAKNGMNIVRGAIELTHRNTRRYGGYLVHMGIVLAFIGFTGHAFNQSEVKELNTGDTMIVGNYQLRMVNLAQGEEENYAWSRATMAVMKHGEMLGTLEPEKRFYKASKQGTSEVGIRVRPNEDLYLNFGGMSDDNQRAVIQAYVFPLVSWIWIGTLVLIFGTLICLVPSKVKMQYARTEVVGYTKANATVKK